MGNTRWGSTEKNHWKNQTKQEKGVKPGKEPWGVNFWEKRSSVDDFPKTSTGRITKAGKVNSEKKD